MKSLKPGQLMSKIRSPGILGISIILTTTLSRFIFAEEMDHTVVLITYQIFNVVGSFACGWAMGPLFKKYKWLDDFFWAMSMTLIMCFIVPALPRKGPWAFIFFVCTSSAILYHFMISIKSAVQEYRAQEHPRRQISIDVMSLIVDSLALFIAVYQILKGFHL